MMNYPYKYTDENGIRRNGVSVSNRGLVVPFKEWMEDAERLKKRGYPMGAFFQNFIDSYYVSDQDSIKRMCEKLGIDYDKYKDVLVYYEGAPKHIAPRKNVDGNNPFEKGLEKGFGGK